MSAYLVELRHGRRRVRVVVEADDALKAACALAREPARWPPAFRRPTPLGTRALVATVAGYCAGGRVSHPCAHRVVVLARQGDALHQRPHTAIAGPVWCPRHRPGAVSVAANPNPLTP